MKVIAVCSKKECAPEKIIEKLDSSVLNEDGLLPVFDITKINEDINGSVKQSLGEADKTIVLGEDHSITIESFTACSSDNPGLIVFAATSDTEFLTELVEKGLKKRNLVLVGIRNWNAQQLNFLRQNKIKVYPMKEIMEEGISEISESIMSVAKDFSELYVSIDINVIDPGFAPGAASVPGGLSSRDLLTFIHRLKKLKNLKIADIIGINTEKDINNATIGIAAKIIIELY